VSVDVADELAVERLQLRLEMADADGNTTTVTFPNVALAAGQQLHLAAGLAGLWNLVDATGHVVASVLSQLIPTARTP
jgi:threonine dehydrogenase-like Zn-dependent dehydrogenase